jgi:arylsulfatase A-like enzyme
MIVTITSVLLSFFGLSLTGKTAQNPEDVVQLSRPNIVIINVDDMGWKDLSFMGSDYYETPNIDELSSKGMIFSNGYSSAANCAPSRACLMTGQYTPRHGIYTVGNSDRGESADRKLIPTINNQILAEDQVTISELLHLAGYKTCIAGKWHLSEDPRKYGFDVNIGGAEYGNPSSYFSPYRNKALTDGPKGEYLTDRLTNETITFLKNVGKQPFFIYFATYAVHSPLQAKEEIIQKYKKKAIGKGQANAVYAAMIEILDQNIGRLIQSLKDEHKYDNTFIIFTSDNGGVYNTSKQWPLRAGKGSYYEGGIRVPMFVVWSGKVKASTTCDVPVSNIDFLPTVLQVANVEIPKNKTVDGESVVSLLTGKASSLLRPLYWHFPVYLEDGNVETRDMLFRTRPGSVIRLGDWKFHEYFEDEGFELYNLKEDVGEKTNLMNKHPEMAKKLHNMLIEWRKKVNAPVPNILNPEYKPRQ